MSTKEMLLELGTEEIPARMMDGALAELKQSVEDWIEEARLGGDDVWANTYGTPRRLVVHASLPESQPDQTVTEKGPPEHIAFADDGEPSQALEGFCSQHGVDPSQVDVEDIDGGTYTVLELPREGQPTHELLTKAAPRWFLGLNWPKTMRWEESGCRFVRPIRWALGFFGDESLDFSVGPVSTGPETRGLRFTDQERLSVDGIEDYFESLADAGIVLDPARREKLIREGAETLADGEGGEAHLPETLLEEVNYLVESPAPFLGRFDEEFLELPRPVLEEAMISHQKYFPVRSNGQLLPVFVGVRNGSEKHLNTVCEGNEKVIRARLSDAVFFYEKDRESEYESFREGLRGVVFQEQLGSLFDKTERLADLVAGVEQLPAGTEELARHVKNDHVTELVGEFPKLQGTMGRIYAEESGWDPDEARVIEEHYRPRGREDQLPQSDAGQWLAFLDRLDTLVGFFALGERVSGSSDPYGLRRDALGLLRIAVHGDVDADLNTWLDRAIEGYESHGTTMDDGVRGELVEFLQDRLYYLLRDVTEGRDDEIHAVLNRFWYRPAEAVVRIQWLVEWRGDSDFEDLYTAAQRVGNISSGVELTDPDPGNFVEEAEQQLWDEYQSYHEAVEAAIDGGDPRQILETMASLRPAVDQFFEDVMVMADDEVLQENRLALLRTIRETFDLVADFPRLERER